MEFKEFNNYLLKKYKTNKIFFDEYMEEALYSKYGFFTNEKVRSKKSGDFLTSPEVSEYFGKIINKWIQKSNLDLNITEFGSGTGSLIEQIKTKNKFAVEKSSTARTELGQKNIQNASNLEELTFKNSDLVFGNEVLDNIPCSIAVYKDGKWQEKIVCFNDGIFSYDFVEARTKTVEWIEWNRIKADENIDIEIQTNIDIFLEKIISKLSPKNILFFDYGYEQKDRSKRKYRSLLRTYKDHHLSVDPILEPGNVDITYDINFSAVIRKLKTLGYESKLSLQRDFLISNGFDEYFDNLQ
ncbi:MAG: SAM-dependent methyltransferase, partial [Candidatus Actinomarina sp.]